MQYPSAVNAFLPSQFCIPPKSTPYIKKRKNNTKISSIVNTNETLSQYSLYNSERSKIRSTNDVIIVGAGVAGSALAHAFAKDGRQVHLIEKNLKEPNRIVGELLQPAGYLKLLELGLEDCVMGIDAQVIHGYSIYMEGKSVQLPYPLEKYPSDVSGKTFHNGRFVQKLRHKAASLPNVWIEQGTASSLIEEGGEIVGVRYTRSGDGGQQIMTAHAPFTVICDGCFSRFRDFLAKPKIDKPSHFICLIVENCEVPLRNYAHAIMGNPSSIVFYPISGTEVRFIIDFPGPKLPSISNGQMADFLINVVASQIIPPEMSKAFISSVKKGKIRTMPVSCMAAATRVTPGAVVIGDALNMRHAISGGGMSVALQDVALLRDLFSPLNFDDKPTMIKYTQHFYNSRKPMAFVINVMANSTHKVLCAPPAESRKQIQKAYFKYLSVGNGAFIRKQSELISGLNPNPWNLVLNLSAMALYIFGALVFPLRSPKQMVAAARVALGISADVIPLILSEGWRQVFFTTKALQSNEHKCNKGMGSLRSNFKSDSHYY